MMIFESTSSRYGHKMMSSVTIRIQGDDFLLPFPLSTHNFRKPKQHYSALLALRVRYTIANPVTITLSINMRPEHEISLSNIGRLMILAAPHDNTRGDMSYRRRWATPSRLFGFSFLSHAYAATSSERVSLCARREAKG